MTKTTDRPKSTPADAACAAARPIPAEKKLGTYPPCPHCGNPANPDRIGPPLVFHCNDKEQCTWLRCVDCLSVIEPSDWSHAMPRQADGHGRTLLRNCHGKR